MNLLPGPVAVASGRRGVAIGAVLLVGLGVLLIVAGTLHYVRAGVASIGGADAAIQTRLAARSAVRVFARNLHENQSGMLGGAVPEPPATYELFELPGPGDGRLAVARLLPLGPGGSRIVSESAKLDLNLATAEELEATGLLSSIEASTIVAARDARPGGRFVHLSDLLSLEGDGAPGPSRVLGPLDELAILSRVDADAEDIGERIASRLGDDLGPRGGATPLAEVLTIHSFEPDLQIDGSERLLLPESGEGSLDLEGLGPETRQYVQAWLGTSEDREVEKIEGDQVPETESATERDSGTTVDEDEFIRRVWTIADRNGGDAGLALDGFTLVDGGWRNGLLDINLASVEALRGLPGIDEEIAAALVARRESIAEDRRFDRFWPVAEGVVDAERWLPVVSRVTTRSLVWRATLAVGIVPADDPDAPLASPIAWEVVVDCGGARPRLVEIRDVTMLELVARMIAGDDEQVFDVEASEPDGPDEDSDRFRGEPLFSEEPLFERQPLFPGTSLFSEDPLFEGPSLFPGSSDSEGTGFGDSGSSTEPRDALESPLRRDRGPGGRWRPATGSR